MAGKALSADKLTGAQKAALLLLHLGKDRASHILKGMREVEVEEIMTEVAMLGDVQPEAMESVLLEFREMAQARSYFAQGGISFAREMLEASLGSTKAEQILGRLEEASMERPFDF